MTTDNSFKATIQAHIWLGLAVFCGFIMFDTQLIIRKARMGDKDFIAHSLDLFIDFVQVFRKVLILLMQKVRQQKGYFKKFQLFSFWLFQGIKKSKLGKYSYSRPYFAWAPFNIIWTLNTFVLIISILRMRGTTRRNRDKQEISNPLYLEETSKSKFYPNLDVEIFK